MKAGTRLIGGSGGAETPQDKTYICFPLHLIVNPDKWWSFPSPTIAIIFVTVVYNNSITVTISPLSKDEKNNVAQYIYANQDVGKLSDSVMGILNN